MKWYGMKDPLEKLLDNLEQGKAGTITKIILSSTLKLIISLLLLGMLVTTIAMLPQVILLALLVMLLSYVLTALENLKL